MVLDVTKRGLIVLFLESLSVPLKGLVRAFDPNSLQEAIRRALNLEDSVAKNKIYSKNA